MTRTTNALFIFFVFIVNFLGFAGCASAPPPGPATAKIIYYDPSPRDPIWQNAIKVPQGEVFRVGVETCAVGVAIDTNATNGRDVAEFAAMTALAAKTKTSSTIVADLPHRSSWWLHADSKTHHAVYCVVMPTTIAAAH